MRLKKPGQAILDSLKAWDCDLIHMAGCLPGEASELWDSVDTNSIELLEELGDFAFYLVATRNLFGVFGSDGWNRTKPNGVRDDHTRAIVHATDLLRLSGHLWDVVKRAVIYRKPFDMADKKYAGMSLREAGSNLLDQIECSYNALLHHYGYKLEDVLEANWEKLASADKGRYASGSYSDEQAQARRDKESQPEG